MIRYALAHDLSAEINGYYEKLYALLEKSPHLIPLR